ncbi:MAG: hypothetical protein QW265_01460 [Candidatus Bathyarchaeia archaeon]
MKPSLVAAGVLLLGLGILGSIIVGLWAFVYGMTTPWGDGLLVYGAGAAVLSIVIAGFVLLVGGAASE